MSTTEHWGTGSARKSGSEPADATFVAGLTRWLAFKRGFDQPRVLDLHRPDSGYASETVFVRVASSGRPHQELVVRMAPPGDGVFADYRLEAQVQAQLAASHAGVMVADPQLETDSDWLGRPFIVMPRVAGHVIEPVVHKDAWISALSTSQRERLYDSMLSTLAMIHRGDINSAPAVPRRDNDTELEHWEMYLSWSTHGHPITILLDALRWCRENRPEHEGTPVLLWGDVRFENVVIGDDLEPLAVLDWDMATVGAPEHDLAWFTSLDITQHRLFGTRTEGFPDRADTVQRFAGFSGRAVRDLDWYETFAMFRSAAILTRIGVLQRDVGRTPMLPIEDNPILRLLRERLT